MVVDNLSMKIDFFSWLTSKSGMGHYHRIQNILSEFKNREDANLLQSYTLTSSHASGGEEGCTLNDSGVFLDTFSFDDLAGLQSIAKANTVVIDIFADESVKEKRLRYFLNCIRCIYRYVIVLDDAGPFSLSKIYPDYRPDLLIYPYPTSGLTISQDSECKHLRGLNYVSLPCSYSNLKKKLIPHVAKKLLVTTGGTDLNFSCNQIIIALLNSLKDIQISVLVGQRFSRESTEQLQYMQQKNPDRLRIINGCCDIQPYLSEADILITASGLTKYEASAVGVPMIIFSVNRNQELSHKSFAALQLSLEVGQLTCTKDILKKFDLLHNNERLRKRLSRASQAAIDGLGARRICDAIVNLTSE